MLFLLILLVSLFFQLFLPWWTIAIIAFFFSAWKSRSVKHAFGQSFLAIFTLWIAVGLIKTLPNNNILANRVGEMLMLPFADVNWLIVLLVTGIVGGLVAAFAGMAGFYLRGIVADIQYRRKK
jgi:hypothetical protein